MIATVAVGAQGRGIEGAAGHVDCWGFDRFRWQPPRCPSRVTVATLFHFFQPQAPAQVKGNRR